MNNPRIIHPTPEGGVAIIIDVTSVRGYGAEGPIEQSI